MCAADSRPDHDNGSRADRDSGPRADGDGRSSTDGNGGRRADRATGSRRGGAAGSGSGDDRGGKMERTRRLLGPLLILVAMLVAWSLMSALQPGPERLEYSAFRQQLAAGNVERVTVQGETMEGRLASAIERPAPGGGTRPVEEFVTYLPSFGDDRLMALLEEHGVEIVTEPSAGPSWWTLLIYLGPFLFLGLFLALGWRRMQQRGQRMFGIGRSKARTFEPREGDRTDFDDVAGCAGPKRELQEVVQFLETPRRFQALGGEMPGGVLLVGPPGTGKTLLARAVAGEAGVPFFSITGSDFMEMFVGVGASRVRDMFEKARKAAPAIVFIDELDSIGRRRGAGLGGGHDEREQTLNQLLSEMDGFESSEGVILMAATNRPDILDPALLRPGRFDRRVTVNLPTREERREILVIHARNKPLADGVDLDELARGTPGFSGADLENLLNEAALLAARRDRERIEEEDVEDARDKVTLGLAREGLHLDEEETRMLAYHEAGHALLAIDLPRADPLHKVTIVPRGRAMGVTQQLPDRERYIVRRDDLQDRLAVIMAGRAAEEIVFGTVTSGAENDLKEATRLARKMVLEWGMSRRFRDVALGGGQEEVFLGEELGRRREHSDATARLVDEEVQSILREARQRARKVLGRRRDELDALAEALIEEEEMDRQRVEEILASVPEPGPVTTAGAGESAAAG